MNTFEFHKGMKDHFGITEEAGQFMCKTLLALKRVSLDIIKFDKWIIKDLGFDYNVKEGLSMKEAIEKYYSKEAVEFVKRAL